ncbi:NADH-quinone oxidoreductase subunit J [Pleurocapsa sp. FMAR1]|uniref:NADH-quinone oxidoreductase subunit J n=1 Tax=Pleurocapsa sp. FMAR1 TaxID=3040204 RepID=UPI0029C8B330|nr:NADH-quinone oxidoreductase subunit J [Pleurocapsa sp. FMAR1]
MNLAEGVQIVSFGILAVMMIGTALGVVLLPKIVHSAFLLAGVFISIAGLYLLLNADFVAAAQILVYVGAVNVLILFAIMLVNKQEDYVELPGRLIRKVATAVVCFGLFALLGTMVLVTPWSLDTTSPQVTDTVVALGEHFFSDYLLPFELASVLLLMAMVGAIILARRDMIPEYLATKETVTTSFTLPERPRELAILSSDSDKQD